MSGAGNPGIKIRAGSADDAAAMAELHAAAFDEPWGEEAIAGLMAMPGSYAFAGVWFGNADNGADNADDSGKGRLRGFVIARIAADEAEILTIAVGISERGQGLGRKLMEAAAAFALASGAVSLFLEVADDNLAALALYERLGFVTVGMRPGYYTRGTSSVAARTMRLDLQKT
jgi:ribosomal-protein-alanine N-acetyltransferase